MTDLRLPNITGNEREQLTQIRSYLYQLVPQLQHALSTIGTAEAQAGTPTQKIIVQTISGGAGGSSSPQSIFDSIKALIIKSADIVDAYYEEINKKLEGLYVSQSDFGSYSEKTSQEIEENSTSTTQRFENIQVIIANHDSDISSISSSLVTTNGDVENLGVRVDDANKRIDSTESSLQDAKVNLNGAIQRVTDSLSTTDKLLESAKAQLQGSIDDLEFYLSGLKETILGITAYIKSGLIDSTDAGVPVYGIEIGQEVESNGEKVFYKFSRFTSEKLSFYDSNDNEVAYISDKKLYIGQAEITISFKVGGLIDLVMSNGDVVTKWEGGS
jgi:hypothetical protein